jgi:iron complex transport system ATP-binding protein
LRAESVSAILGGRTVVSQVTLTARPGETVGLIGPNGAGKTTLLRVLAGLTAPSSGHVWLGGKPLAGMKPAERARRTAYMPQFAERHPFTALETVLMGRYPHLGRFEVEGSQDLEAAFAAMRRTGTGALAGRQLDTLSGGERQRVLLARALAQGADVLLLDEPTAALDLRHRLITMEVIREEVAARDALAVTAMHDLSLAGRYCDRLVLLSEGRVLAAGTPAEALTEDNLRASFGVETVVEPDAVTGRPQVTLLGPSNGVLRPDLNRDQDAGRQAQDAGRRRLGEGVRVHVICGAGSGRDLMFQLVSAGYTVTACVLGQGDTDRETAERLRIEFVPAPPFSAITPEEHAAHLALVGAADYVVLCDMAVGRNNLPNLHAAARARRLLAVDGRPFAELDYTGGEASTVYAPVTRLAERIARSDVLRSLARHGSPAT